MKVECWRWRYRDSSGDRVWRTTLALTEEEAAKYPGAQRIEGSRCLRDPEQRPGAAPTPSEAFNRKSRKRTQAELSDSIADA